MKYERWHKKDVVLTWNARRTSFAVAQELFSSHDVDTGSKLLLRSVDVTAFPASGHAVDFGSGYGVLGLAWRDAMPGWTVELIDRDALAVGFSRWNTQRLGFEDGSVTCTVGLGMPVAPAVSIDLVLWNVPGKAGEEVIRALSRNVAAALADRGLAALVVVNPLAAVIRQAFEEIPGTEVVADRQHADHTVIHVRKSGPVTATGDPFERGVFDRGLAGFGVDEFDYEITTVFGVPEYDSYSYASQVVFDSLRTVEHRVDSVLVMRPGQGHLPLVIANKFQPERLALADRDQLALRTSVRALVEVGPRVPTVEIVATPDLVDVVRGEPFSLVVLMLEEQVRNEIHLARLSDLAGMMETGCTLIVGGTSSVVSRFLALAAKTNGWRTRDRIRRSGASAARLQWLP